MFVHIGNSLVNFDQVTKILLSRDKEAKPKDDVWNVVVVYTDTKALDSNGEMYWTGGFDTLKTGKRVECENYIEQLSEVLRGEGMCVHFEFDPNKSYST